jgi:hypothetical protein
MTDQNYAFSKIISSFKNKLNHFYKVIKYNFIFEKAANITNSKFANKIFSFGEILVKLEAAGNSTFIFYSMVNIMEALQIFCVFLCK